MAIITGALPRIRQDLSEHLSERDILDVCRGSGHVWRGRKPGPVLTVHLQLAFARCNTA